MYTGNIFKFLDEKGGISALEKATIKFVKPTFTNDPFEVSKEIVEFGDPVIIVDDIIGKYYSELSIAKKRTLRAKKISALRNGDFSNIFEQSRDTIGFASFSKKCTNPLMWAYYANSHKGICIQYGVNNIIFQDGRNLVYCMEVDYMSVLKKIVFDPRDHINFMTKWITTKSYHWIHEEEVRLLYLDFPYSGVNTFIPHEKEIIKKVIFGLKTEIDTMDKVYNIIKEKYSDHSIEITKMQIGSELFTLEEVPYVP